MPWCGVATWAFGLPHSLDANVLLSQLTELVSDRLGRAPIFTQPLIRVPDAFDVTYVAEPNDVPAPTLRIARGVAHWAQTQRLDEIHVVAAGPHLPRCLRDLGIAFAELGLDTTRIIPAPEILSIPMNEWFCPDSGQWHTRSSWAWTMYSRMIYAIPRRLYAGIGS